MKYFLFLALALSLLFSSCVPATQLPVPTTTLTRTPNPTATLTLTPTSTPSPTPDPMQVVINQLEKEGIKVEVTTGKISYKGIEVPGTTIDANGLHLRIGDKKIDIPQSEILTRFGIKEGGIAVFNDFKDSQGNVGIDTYKNDDMSQWAKVELAFEPTNTETKWAGWVQESDAISKDKRVPVEIGNTMKDYEEFSQVFKKFLDPFPKQTKRLEVRNADYIHYDGTAAEQPFKPVDDWSDPNFINPFRGGQGYWMLRANPNEGRPKDTVGAFEQVYDQIFAPVGNEFEFVDPAKQDIQGFTFASAVDSSMSPDKFFTYYGKQNEQNPDLLQLPLYTVGMPFTGRLNNLVTYYKQFGYLNPDKSTTGKMERELKEEFMVTGRIPEDLQNAWVDAYQVWYHGLGF